MSKPDPQQEPAPSNGRTKQKSKSKAVGYQSEGVQDNDIFNLPSGDLQLLGFLTLAACFVRLFRIYQPSSVVFDEVQYVPPRSEFALIA
jgi:dolichyl-phosphate-mannose-protein mannosyltransferase